MIDPTMRIIRSDFVRTSEPFTSSQSATEDQTSAPYTGNTGTLLLLCTLSFLIYIMLKGRQLTQQLTRNIVKHVYFADMVLFAGNTV